MVTEEIYLKKEVFSKKRNFSMNNSYLLLFLSKKKKTAGIYCSQRRVKFSSFLTVNSSFQFNIINLREVYTRSTSSSDFSKVSSTKAK
jgi:hypothetical protein